jgi:ATP adenylyltransferase
VRMPGRFPCDPQTPLENASPRDHADDMKSTCNFCQKFGGAPDREQISDHVLFESENFVVVPTIGSIIPGWLLAVPRSHFLSIGSLHAARHHEFIRLQETAAEALRDCFGPVSCFEHGAVRERESVGCGVDHAHLHIVSTQFDLLACAKASGEAQLHWRPVSGIQAARAFVAEQMPYVFVQSLSGGAWIGSANVIESQFIRKVIAAQVGQPDFWDWRAHPFETNVRETVLRLEAWKAARSAISASV